VRNAIARNASFVTDPRLDELVCFAIYSAANSTSQAYRQVLAPWNLTYTQYLVLVVLADDDRTVSALGHELGLDSGTVSPLLARLADRGLVRRERRDRDERVVTVTLTEEGRSTRRAVAEAVGCLVPAFVEASSDLPELLRQLHEVTHNMRQLTTDLRSA
jgi:DNA-binding MarR family transcriptional regulator